MIRRCVAGATFAAALLFATAATAAAPFSSAPHFGDLAPLPDRGLKLSDFQPRGQDMAIDRRYFGLHHTDVWFDMLVTEDNGTYHLTTHDIEQTSDGGPLTDAPSVTNELQGGGAVSAGLSLGFMSSPVNMLVDPDYKPYLGAGHETLVAGDRLRYVFTSPLTTDTITFGPSDFTWKAANGDIDLNGTLVAPGAMWFLKWTNPPAPTNDEMLYGAVYYRVDGSYYGRAVHGYVYVENMWGQHNYGLTWWVQHRHGHWTFWTTQYDDGSQEYGQFLCFDDAAAPRAAIITNSAGQVVVNTDQINAYVHKDAGGDLTRIDYTFGNGEQWVFTADPSRNALPGGSLSGGRMARLGERRKIVRSDAVQLIAGDMCAPQKLTPPAVSAVPFVKIRGIALLGRRLRVKLAASNGTLSRVRITLRRAGRTLRATTVTRLTGRRTMTMTLRRRPAPGNYTITASAPGVHPVSGTLTVTRR